MKLVTQTEIAKILGITAHAPSVVKLLAKHGVKPVAEVKYARGYARSFNREEVLAVAAKINPPKVAQAAAPAQVPLGLEDPEAQIKALTSTVESLKKYICDIGERQAKIENAVRANDSATRTAIIGIDRLLKAGGLQPVGAAAALQQPLSSAAQQQRVQ